MDRKIRDQMKVLLDEEPLLSYIQRLSDALWPGGILKLESVPRSPKEKSKTRTEARAVLASLVPGKPSHDICINEVADFQRDLSASVVGRANANSASRRIFAVCNNPRLK
jgi:sorting nexin-25